MAFDPTHLNQQADPKNPRIFNAHLDHKTIQDILDLDGSLDSRGKRTIAINPTWNTERIAIQQGVFTLHGSLKFELDRHQASSLLAVPILKEHKINLRSELERVGIGEMFVYPEPEHVCSHLRRSAGL